jgi:hypothetical protein
MSPVHSLNSTYKRPKHLFLKIVRTFDDCCVLTLIFDSTSLIQKDSTLLYTTAICSLRNSHIAREDILLKTRVNICYPLSTVCSSSFSMLIDRFYVLKLSYFTIPTLYVFFLFSMNFPIFLTPLIYRTRDTSNLIFFQP